MRNSVKIVFLFIFLSLLFSCLAGCSNSGESSSNVNTANSVETSTTKTESTKTDSADTSAKSDYPEVPADIMQANIESVDGGSFKLADKKGKVVLVNLWGIWCGPCKAEMPHLIELQDKYRDQGFEIIGLNVGDESLEKESAENIRKFAEQMKLNYQLAWADDKVYMDFLNLSKFQGVPQSFLIDREGRFRGVFKGASQRELNKLDDNLVKLMSAG